MRIAKVIGSVVLNHQLANLRSGRYLIAEALDHAALAREVGASGGGTRRVKPGGYGGAASSMSQSLVVFDELGAGIGQFIAVSEGREAAMPFYPDKVPYDAYNAASLDQVEIDPNVTKT